MLGIGYSDVAPGQIATVVTHLEMTTKPSPMPVPADLGLELVRHETPDPDWYRALFRKVGEDWLWCSRLRMDQAELARVLTRPGSEIYAVEEAGDAVGLLELQFNNPDEAEISFFGLAPQAIGRGAGRWLMAQALQKCWGRGISRLWVQTCTLDSPQALGFYQAMGFNPYRRRVEVISDPRLDGTLARDAAPHVPVI